MQNIIKNSLSRLKLPKPKNCLPSFCTNITDNELKTRINSQLSSCPTISSIINGHEFDNPYSISSSYNISPYDGKSIIYEKNMLSLHGFQYALNERKMIHASKHWNSIGLDKRIEHFHNIATYIEQNINDSKTNLIVSTMVGQGKSIFEAEIDICELIDFLNFNNYNASEMNNKSLISNKNETNISEITGLNGFFASISPFNFTSIGANLASAPLLMGNPVVWKPSLDSLLSNKLYFDIMLENNIPPELISFVVMDGKDFIQVVSEKRDLTGIAFTGSSTVFNSISNIIGAKSDYYNNYPRLIGETGGKNFHFVHPSADAKLVADKTFRAFTDYRGQKCSACSRLYVPESLWGDIKLKLVDLVDLLQRSNDSDLHLINQDKERNICYDMMIIGNHPSNTVVYNNNGYLIVETSNHDQDMFHTEYFAPILSVYVYPDNKIYDALEKCSDKSKNRYTLTGAIFANSKDNFIEEAYDKMRFSAGNLYINDKCTGSVVGQQPFGGIGKSGTGEKTGDVSFLYRFANQRTTKFNMKNNKQ